MNLKCILCSLSLGLMSVFTAVGQSGNFDFFSDFETSAAPFNVSNNTTNGRTSFDGSQVLLWTISGQSGNRTNVWDLSNTVTGRKINLKFDWYAGNVINNSNTASLSITDAKGGGNAIFTLVWSQSTTNGRIRYLTGNIVPDGNNPPIGTAITGINTLDRWYTIDITFDFQNQVCSFTITDRTNPSTTRTVTNIPLSKDAPPQSAIGGLFLVGHRASGQNISLTTAIDNFGYKVIEAGQPIVVEPPVEPLPQRQMEQLSRGLVAVKINTGVFMSWRLFATDPENVTFNIYKNNGQQPLNTAPLKPAYTNFTDNAGRESDRYSVAVLVDGRETARSEAVSVWANQYLRIPVQKPTGYLPDNTRYTDYSIYDGSVADLDGDGNYEIVFLWAPANMKDNSQSGLTGNVYIDAYKLDGTKLWGSGKWIDLGRNIRAGAHYLPFLVFDFDGDGKAEIIIRVSDGTKDTQGRMIGQDTRYANDNGYVLTGPEYVAVFEGATGKLLDYVSYEPVRGNVNDWGDNYGNRVDRFLAGVAYLDGVHPSAVMTRGYYTRTVLVAWDWDGKKLTKRWTFDSRTSGRQYEGQGNHQLSVADVDGDGKDDIIYGALTIRSNGTPMYSTGFQHGDALHVGKLNPSRPGLQIMSVHESPNPYGMEMHDAKTGEVIWGVEATTDIGRGLSADIDPDYPGVESWGAGGMAVRAADGTRLSGSAIGSINMAIWWDGDTGRELFDGGANPTVRKVNVSGTAPNRTYKENTIFTFSGASTNGGTKNNPCLQADILGDWREEVILRETGDGALRIYTTTTPTVHNGAGKIPESGIPTLMHDNIYRLAIAWQNGGYNQPPHTSFFLGYNMENVLRIGENETGEPTVVSEFERNNLSVYPNPARDIVSISGLECDEIITITDITGRKLLQIKANTPKEDIAVSHLPKGMYLVIITKDRVEKVTKLVME